MSFIAISLLVILVIANRYFAGRVATKVAHARLTRVREDYFPTVDVVIPMFNEGRGIKSTILSLLAQDYPADKLRVVVVDDCSTDDSLFWARKAAALHPERTLVIKNRVNGTWQGWGHIGTPMTPYDSSPGIASRGVDKLDVFVLALDGKVYVRSWNAGWSGWNLVAGPPSPYVFTQAPAAVATSSMSGSLPVVQRAVRLCIDLFAIGPVYPHAEEHKGVRYRRFPK